MVHSYRRARSYEFMPAGVDARPRTGARSLMGQLADLAQDLRYAVRTLRRGPVFTLIAIVTLALAIGANTAIFSLVDLIVFRDLPVRAPGRLVEFIYRYPGDPPRNGYAADFYNETRTRTTVFSDVIGVGPVQAPIGNPGETLRGEYVTGNFFPALGVQAARGRLLGPEDDQPRAPGVAVVSWSCWQNHFHQDPGILGRAISVAGAPVTVIGVADQRFVGVIVGYQPDLWIPAAAYKNLRGYMVAARLKDGASIEQARAEMQVRYRPVTEELGRRDPQWRTVNLEVRSMRAGMATPLHEQFARPLVVLLAVVGTLLLLACANIGSLMLARAAARQREMAVRVSLGAGRLRIVRQVLTESLLLAAVGSVVGTIGAYFGAGLLVRIMSSGTRLIGLPPRLDITIDGRVLLFTMAVTLVAAVLFGLAPAWAAFAYAPAAVLKEGTATGQGQSRRLFGSALVAAQVALSLVLLSVSHLYVVHLWGLRNRDLGFERNSVLLVSVDLGRSGLKREQLNPLYPDLLDRLQAIPGVFSATVSGMTPISGSAGSAFVTVEGFQEAPQARRRVLLNGVAPNYFATYGTPLLGGRDFRTADATGPRVTIVNRAWARHYVGGGDPIGKRIWLDGQPQPFEIIGLVADAKYSDVRTPAPPIMYMVHSHLPGRPASEFSLRTSVPPTSIIGDVRRVIADVLPNAPVSKTTTLAEQVDAAIVPERLIATLSGFFGIVGMLLAALGLYGLLAYTVARRTNEIGLRMALGAVRRDLILLILKDAFWLVCVGLLIGSPVAIWAKQAAAGMVQNLASSGATPIVVASAATIGVALLAAYLPARRATRVDPLLALRSE